MLSDEQVEEELDTRNYTTKFRTEFQRSGLPPFQWFKQYFATNKGQNTNVQINVEQSKMLEEIKQLAKNKALVQSLSEKYQGVVINACAGRWDNTPMPDKAYDFYCDVLTVMRKNARVL